MDKIIEKVKELSKNKNYVIGAAVAAVVVVALVLFLVFRSTPERAAKEFMEAYSKADAKKIMNIIYFDEDKNDPDDVEEDIDNFADYVEKKDITITYKMGKIKESTSGKTAKVKVKITMKMDKKDSSSTKIIYLRKVDGKWKVDADKTGLV